MVKKSSTKRRPSTGNNTSTLALMERFASDNVVKGRRITLEPQFAVKGIFAKAKRSKEFALASSPVRGEMSSSPRYSSPREHGLCNIRISSQSPPIQTMEDRESAVEANKSFWLRPSLDIQERDRIEEKSLILENAKLRTESVASVPREEDVLLHDSLDERQLESSSSIDELIAACESYLHDTKCTAITPEKNMTTLEMTEANHDAHDAHDDGNWSKDVPSCDTEYLSTWLNRVRQPSLKDNILQPYTILDTISSDDRRSLYSAPLTRKSSRVCSFTDLMLERPMIIPSSPTKSIDDVKTLILDTADDESDTVCTMHENAANSTDHVGKWFWKSRPMPFV